MKQVVFFRFVWEFYISVEKKRKSQIKSYKFKDGIYAIEIPEIINKDTINIDLTAFNFIKIIFLLILEIVQQSYKVYD